MEQDFGIYQAIVTDNSTFYTTGKIRVRIQKFYNEDLSWDISKNYDDVKYNIGLTEDLEAFVHTPLGGGNNYGFFALPQVNSVGIIQFLNGNYKNPIWMGSFFRPEFDSKNNVTRVNIPNDQPLYEGLGSDGIATGSSGFAEKKTKGGPGSIVLRTKTTSGPGEEKEPKNMDFNRKRTENLVVLSEEEIKIMHFSSWEDTGSGENLGNTADLKQFEEITVGTMKEYGATGEVIDQYPQIDIKVTDNNNDDDKKKTLGIKINPDEVSFEVISKENETISKIGAIPTGISILSTDTNDARNTTSYEMTPKKVTMINKKLTIIMENDQIILSAPEGKIRLSGKEILLGDGGGYVVIKDNQVPMRMEDGSILKTTNIRA
jgi:hypothetical protein